MIIILNLWLHREEGDAWLVSVGGIGAGVFLAKSLIDIEDGHPVPVFAPVGPVRVELPDWLAAETGLVTVRDERQGEMF